MNNAQQQAALRALAGQLHETDAVLIGASNGLSITEGLHLFADNAAFSALYGDFKQRYGVRCLLQGMMAQWPTEEEYWAFWARAIRHYCANYRPTQVMQDLRAVVGNKDYFVVTSNGECHFEACGFDPARVYEVEGTWLQMQCADGCHDALYPTQELAVQMAEAEQGGKVPPALVPRCPQCSGPMRVHMAGPHFVPQTAAEQRMQAFLARYHGKRLVILELGIGWRNQLIKAPLMRLVAQEPLASYATFNLGELYIPAEIQHKSFGIDGSLDETLAALREACGA